jgi:alanyl-tRNA synthetase
MKTDELREKYLEFFASKGCVRRPSDVLVPKDDASVLFTPAGMNQFKNQFLGIGKLEFTKATTCQKCLRTGDISNVGVTAYHHTFFEMLGNFSFGDYFKKEAIHWAWEFLTTKKWLGLEADRLTVTVYLDDDEAFNIWHKEVGLSTDRIKREDEKENFWPASSPSQGPDGVCGPCSEIYYHPPGGHKSVEIWNLVFTQFNRVGPPPNNLRPLPMKNIDTGMGLERTASTLQGKVSNFEIDILKPLCVAAGDSVGKKYEFDAPFGRPLRRIADHVRAVTFAVHEGVQPSNAKAGYVIRQLLRRAVLEGYLLGRHDPFLHGLVPAVVEAMKKPYPEIAQTVATVQTVIKEEESQFLGTIERGLSKFNKCLEKAQKSGSTVISGDDAFDLHQTDGFLIELTQAMAATHNLTVDMKRFDSRQTEHATISGSGAFLDSVMSEGPLDAIRKTAGDTEFLGYDRVDAEGEVVGIISGGQLVSEMAEIGEGAPIGVVLDETPFYGEAGGQVGDIGALTGSGVEFQVMDTQKNGGLILHIGHLKSGKLEVGKKVKGTVDAERRAGIRRAHSATHLLHHALRLTLGPDATQRGSKVQEDELRFDFAHRKALSPEELVKVENEINARIAEGAAVVTKVMEIGEAKKLGAMALFGEKYPDHVRVVRMGEFSTELCGGTHLGNTGQAGLCRIVRDELIAAGVRRITAITGPRALQKMRDNEHLLKELGGLLKATSSEELPRRVIAMQEELARTRKELAGYTKQANAGLAEELLAKAETVGAAKIVIHQAGEGSRESFKELVDGLRGKNNSVAILLGCVQDGKVAFTAAVSKDLLAKGLSASECVKAAAKVTGGGGGGKPDLADAGGKDPAKIEEALAAGRAYYTGKLGS